MEEKKVINLRYENVVCRSKVVYDGRHCKFVEFSRNDVTFKRVNNIGDLKAKLNVEKEFSLFTLVDEHSLPNNKISISFHNGKITALYENGTTITFDNQYTLLMFFSSALDGMRVYVKKERKA